MAASNNIKILSQNLYDALINNRVLLIKNVSINEEFINLCNEKKIINSKNLFKLRSSDSNDDKVDCIIESLKMKSSKFFQDFCEVLVVTGHPLVAEILNGTASTDYNIDLKDIWDEIPSFKKSLTQRDKDSLFNYITNKIKSETTKILLSQPKETQRKNSMAKINQIEQSWKFQKEMKGKNQMEEELKNKINAMEEKLIEKENQITSIIADSKAEKDKQKEAMVIAAKFNTANDKELQRSVKALSLYKSVISKVSKQIRDILQSSSDSHKQLMRESSDSVLQKYDLQHQLEIFERLFEIFIKLCRDLIKEIKEYEKLKLEVDRVIKSIQPNKSLPSVESLTSVIRDYEHSVNSQMSSLEEKLTIQEKFIYGLLPAENIPEKFQNIAVPSNERSEYLDIISELNKKTEYLEAALAEKEKELKSSLVKLPEMNRRNIFEVIPEEEKIINDSLTKKNQNNNGKTPTYIPFSNSYKTVKSSPTPKQNPKFKKANVFKTNVVSFI